MGKNESEEEDDVFELFLIIAVVYGLAGAAIGALAQSFDFPLEGIILLLFPTTSDLFEAPLIFALKIICVPIVIAYLAAKPRRFHFV
ncbi:MAG: hypothetical protein NTZ73_02800 [Candidatus Diapherotrites archaeon]|nr:hypothetical protein [Candidatus Diapherotrites archaeon]